MKKLLLVGLMMLSSFITFAQISGTVLDSDTNSPLPGATVIIQGTSDGVVTDFDGNEIGYSAVMDDITRFVPIAEGNREYQLIQEWVAQDGNTIVDTDVPTP